MATKNGTTTTSDPKPPKAEDALGISDTYRPAKDAPPPLDLELLAKAKGYLPDCGAYGVTLGRAVTALVGTRAVAYDAADARDEIASKMASAVKSGAESVARDAATKGDPTGATLVAAFIRDREIDLTRAARDEQADRATNAADGAEAALKAAEEELAAGRRRAAYASLSGKATADDLARVQLLEREVRARGLEYLHDAVDSAHAASAMDECRLFVLAADPWVREVLATDPKKRRFAETAGGTREARVDDTFAKENAVANALLRAFEQIRVELVDPALVLASDVFVHLLIPVFRMHCGFATFYDLPREKFDATSAQSGKLPDPYQRLQDWWVRNLPFGRADYGRADTLTLARRGGAGGPPGWGQRRRATLGWERVSIGNAVQPQRFGMGG
ncbi:MAG TPA: hypothetical protein VIY73_05495 [Polyangiaceae bacterium]